MTTAYPGESWESLALKLSTNVAAHKEFALALKVAAGHKPKDFLAQSFATDKALELCTEQAYIIVSEKDFLTKYGIQPAFIPGLQLDNFETESGTVRGIAVVDPENPHRRLIVRRRIGTHLNTVMLNGSEQVRPEQGTALAAWYEPDALRTRAASVQKGWTLESLAEACSKALAEKKAAEERAEAEKAAARAGSAMSSVQQAGERHDLEEEHDEEDVAMVAPLQLLSAEEPRRRGRGGRGCKGVVVRSATPHCHLRLSSVSSPWPASAL